MVVTILIAVALILGSIATGYLAAAIGYRKKIKEIRRAVAHRVNLVDRTFHFGNAEQLEKCIPQIMYIHVNDSLRQLEMEVDPERISKQLKEREALVQQRLNLKRT